MYTRQTLAERYTITMEKAFDRARSLELAEMHSASYLNNTANSIPVATVEHREGKLTRNAIDLTPSPSDTLTRSEKCFFCGNNSYPRNSCPAKKVICRRLARNGIIKESANINLNARLIML